MKKNENTLSWKARKFYFQFYLNEDKPKFPNDCGGCRLSQERSFLRNFHLTVELCFENIQGSSTYKVHSTHYTPYGQYTIYIQSTQYTLQSIQTLHKVVLHTKYTLQSIRNTIYKVVLHTTYTVHIRVHTEDNIQGRATYKVHSTH